VSVTGIERQGDYAALARRNAEEAGLAAGGRGGRYIALPVRFRQMSFDHVIANPPYLRADAGTAAQDIGKEASFREDTPLANWIAVARARLKPKGWLTMIQNADRLPDMLAALDGFGSVSVMPLQSRVGRAAGRFLLGRARAGGRRFSCLRPLLVHEGARICETGKATRPR
jgi:tRNA1Val (adenine37-N6)-methyltransferase